MNTLTGILELPSAGGDGRIRQFKDGLVETPDDPYVPTELVDKFILVEVKYVLLFLVDS
jgi:hypothetical protein